MYHRTEGKKFEGIPCLSDKPQINSKEAVFLLRLWVFGM